MVVMGIGWGGGWWVMVVHGVWSGMWRWVMGDEWLAMGDG